MDAEKVIRTAQRIIDPRAGDRPDYVRQRVHPTSAVSRAATCAALLRTGRDRLQGGESGNPVILPSRVAMPTSASNCVLAKAQAPFGCQVKCMWNTLEVK